MDPKRDPRNAVRPPATPDGDRWYPLPPYSMALFDLPDESAQAALTFIDGYLVQQDVRSVELISAEGKRKVVVWKQST